MQTKRDLLIMLDESYSVGEERYEKVKRIAAAIVKCKFFLSVIKLFPWPNSSRAFSCVECHGIQIPVRSNLTERCKRFAIASTSTHA